MAFPCAILRADCDGCDSQPSNRSRIKSTVAGSEKGAPDALARRVVRIDGPRVE